MASLDEVIAKLGIEGHDGYVTNLRHNQDWHRFVPYRLQKGLEEIAPDSLYIREGRVLILFFDLTEDTRDKHELSQKVWNLGGAPLVYFIDEDTVTILNGYIFDINRKEFQPLEVGRRRIGEPNYWDIISGKLWSELSGGTNASRVDEYLLANIQSAQEILLQQGLSAVVANSLIGRLLFCRYLLDREVRTGSDYFTDKQSFLELIVQKEQLYNFFDYLADEFNGDLFPVSDEEITSVDTVHLELLHRLFNGDELRTGQISLFDYYNFRIIPVELISEVYERFIGVDSQRSEGAYYTPSFLVDYVLAKTVKKRLETQDDCKVLDPSCGSGIFLVESLRSIIEKRKTLNGGSITKAQLVNIVKSNIFGVDKDNKAVNLTIFSLYLTLLDYQEPRDITQFKFPRLKNKNIFTADFFDTDAAFNAKFARIDFDYILGNPPWKSERANDYHYQYYTARNLPISDRQIAQTFAWRVKDFAKEMTQFALILTSKILYNNNAKRFRKSLLESFVIQEVLELSPVRKQIFKKAIAPSFILFYKVAVEQEHLSNVILHTSLKPNIFLKYLNLITIEKADKKSVQQSYFLKYDWLWKAMLYGNVLDFTFLKRLVDDFPSLNDLIAQNDLVVGQGVQIGGGDSHDATHLVGKKYLDTGPSKRALDKFLIKENILEDWNITSLHRVRAEGLFEGPYVLLKKGFGSDFATVSAYSENSYVFTDSITAIKGSDQNKELLENISGYLNSSFSSYFNLLQGSSIGVEREQGHNENDRFRLPISVSPQVSSTAIEIQSKKSELYRSDFYNAELDAEIKDSEQELNQTIYESLNVSAHERLLIDYCLEVSIPLFKGEAKPYEPASDQILLEYAKFFTNSFSYFWNSSATGFLHADIYRNKYVVGINFTVSSTEREPVIEFRESTEAITELMASQMNIASEMVTDRIFIQKDVRGMTRDTFYLLKPNELKNWHKAVALIDIADFMKVMVGSVQPGAQE